MDKLLKISILSIGDELCIGQTINTNAATIAEKCIKTGAQILTHSTIPDDKVQILNEFERLSLISDIIITTGGLGPTHDDFTKSVICEYLNTELMLIEEIFAKLIDKYTKKRRKTNSVIIKEQAFIPDGSIALYNEVGTAPGLVFQKNDCMFFALPGVPKEAEFLTEQYIIGILNNKIRMYNHSVLLYKTIRTAGIFEVDLAKTIGNLDFLGKSSLAFLPSYRGVKIRIGIESDSLSNANIELKKHYKYIANKISQYINSENDEDLIETIAQLFINTNTTVAVAESCTGGMLGSALTDLPGSSSFFLGGFQTYTNESKNKFLGVNINTLNKFGAVSEETALEMSRNIREKFKANFGIGITGIAGPSGGSKNKPVGTVWIGISTEEKNYATRYIFGSNRAVNRELSVGQSLNLLLKELKNIEKL